MLLVLCGMSTGRCKLFLSPAPVLGEHIDYPLFICHITSYHIPPINLMAATALKQKLLNFTQMFIGIIRCIDRHRKENL